MERQLEILNKLSQIISEEANHDYEEVGYKGIVNIDEGWAESSFYYIRANEKKSVHLSREARQEISLLVRELHNVMLAHTGGNWEWFTLTIDDSGQAKTHFEYN
jgi:hypothetical protein